MTVAELAIIAAADKAEMDVARFRKLANAIYHISLPAHDAK